MKFLNKLVLVNGGSRGIGAAIVRGFHQEGAKVIFTYKQNKDCAEELIESLGGDRIAAFAVDNENPEAIASFMAQISQEHRILDVLVNNAGIVTRGLIAQLTMEQWQQCFAVNLQAPLAFAQGGLRMLMRAKGSAIINISSVTADCVSVGLGAYCASKRALESLTQTMALEFASYKIRVNSIAPGLIQTDVSQETDSKTKDKIINEKTPMRRMGTAEEVAQTALFLASDAASYTTGSKFFVTGGRHLQ